LGVPAPSSDDAEKTALVNGTPLALPDVRFVVVPPVTAVCDCRCHANRSRLLDYRLQRRNINSFFDVDKNKSKLEKTQNIDHKFG